MGYLLTVRTVDGRVIHDREEFESVDSALAVVGARYVADRKEPVRWIGYFIMREGELAGLRISRSTAGLHLRGDIDTIDIMSADIVFEPLEPPAVH